MSDPGVSGFGAYYNSLNSLNVQHGYDSGTGRQPTSYNMPVPPTSSDTSSRSPPVTILKSTSTQELNSLVYAPGLKSSGIHSSAGTLLPHAATTASSSNHGSTQTENTGHQLKGVSSSAQNTPQSYANSARQHHLPQNHQVPLSNQRLAVSAAQALAGAVSRSQQSQQTSESSMMGNSASQPALSFRRPESADANGQQTVPSAEQTEMPIFVDTSKVFNPYHKEHERRRRETAEVKAAAERRTAEVAAQPKPSLPPMKPRSVPISAPNTQSSRPGELTVSDGVTEKQNTGTASSFDIDMASELKAMMDKIKELKNKDPTMFTKLWENMRKGGGSTTAMTQISLPQISQALPAKARPQAKASTSAAKVNGGLGQQKPSNTSSEPLLNGCHVVFEGNAEGLPDIGPFPAKRRIPTGGYSKKKQTPEGLLASVSQSSPISATPASNENISAASRPHSVPLMRPLPGPAAGGSTIWPEAKRNALAEAAIKALSLNPENKRIGITTAEIHSMLGMNPSYLDLCQQLETRGLKFHRGQFARYLLSNVPELTAQTEKAVLPAQQTTASVASPPVIPAQEFASPVHVLQSLPNVAKQPYSYIPPGQMYTSVPITNHLKTENPPPPPGYVPYHGPRPVPISTPSLKAVKARQGAPTPPVPVPKPGSKEAMSRKRNFSDLVDLTQLSDLEDYIMPRKQGRVASPLPELGPIAAYQKRSHPPGTVHAVQGPSLSFAALQSYGLSLPPSHMSSMNNGQNLQAAIVSQHTTSQPAQRVKAIHATAINKLEALQKSYYDPKTVARDVLIAAGRHPTERPLNAHMAGLLGVHIELDSDLSTFDWDAIDPGGPKAPNVEYVDIPAGPPRFKLGDKVFLKDGERLSHPLHAVDQERRQQRRMEKGEGRAKEDSPAKPGIPANALISRFSAQTKQLLRDSINKPSHDQGRVLSQFRHSHVVDDNEAQPNAEVTPQKHKASSQISIDPSATSHLQHRSTRSISKASDKMDSGVKRRGRPAGSKNKNPSVFAMKKDAKPRVIIPTRTNEPSPPTFLVYKCRWRSCNAQLHNLPTLRQHVAKIHKPQTELVIRDGYICWWRKCQYLQPNKEDGTIQPVKSFELPSDWLDHIDEEHLHPLGQKCGDGPSTSHIGKLDFNVSKFLYNPVIGPFARIVSYIDPQSITLDKKRYLADENKQITTPVASGKLDELPADVIALTSVTADNHMHVKSYEQAHGNTSSKGYIKKASEDMLAAMEVRKEKVGPGIDRGGCTLVNDARRATLVQNANIARVVDYHY